MIAVIISLGMMLYVVVGFAFSAIVACWRERKVPVNDQDFVVYLILWPIVLSYLFLRGMGKIFRLDYVSAFKKLNF